VKSGFVLLSMLVTVDCQGQPRSMDAVFYRLIAGCNAVPVLLYDKPTVSGLLAFHCA
jgi:hypothetical protein